MDWEEPGYLKFLKAIQGVSGNNCSYLVPINTVRIYCSRGGLSTRGKVSPPTSCMLSFLCYDKEIEKSLVIESFWKPFKKVLETISPISSLCTVRIYMQHTGDTLPHGKVSPPPPPQKKKKPSCMLSFLCYDKGIEKSLVIWSSESPSRGYWKQFLLSRLCEHRICLR